MQHVKMLLSSCLKTLTGNTYFSTDAEIVLNLMIPGEDNVPLLI